MPEPTEIRTERLLLRPFRLTDADAVYSYAKDPEWGRFLSLPSPYEYRHAEAYVADRFLAPWDSKPSFAITLDGAFIGDVQVRIDADNSVADIGYGISGKRWGKGLTAEAVAAVIGWAFEEFDLAKVGAYADLENRQSWRVMEKLGMKREGIFRSAQPSATKPGERIDMVHYGMLREEWEGRSG